jgi:predicted MFS family arabinose efflux permease
MSQFHGFFSVGGLASATLGGLMIGAGYGNGSGALAVAVLLLIAGTWALTGFIEFPAPPRPGKGEPKFALPAGALIGIAVLAFFCNGIEGSVNDWSTLFLHTVKGMSEAGAAWGYAMFALAMASMRFAGGAIVERVGEQRLISLGGVFVALGMGVAIFAPPLISPVGFLIVGLGAANAIPILVSSGARVPGVAPSIGVAAISTAALVGFLLGPPAIGFLAQAFGLGAALGIVGAAGLLVALLAFFRQWTPAPRAA